jgi:transcription-repair coupling factor (superfamily II helicase)
VAEARSTTGVVLAVVPTDKDVEQQLDDIRFFWGAIEGADEQSVERAVVPFPSHQVDPYRGMTPHFRVTAARARALHGAATGDARVIVASAAALLPRVSPPRRVKEASIELKPGSEIEPVALADLLTDAGFDRQDPVDEHGEFTVRGGIVDVFPAGDTQPVRIEFVGDMVESLRRYDPATQRSTDVIDQLAIVPLREKFEDDPDGITVLEYLSESALRVVVSEFEQVEETALKLRGQLDESFQDALSRRQAAPSPSQLFTDWEEHD